MRELTAEGRAKVGSIAQRQGFSLEAALTMLDALERGHGRMAQFNHPEFGGSGQWMAGGMTMAGNMFDSALKARIAQLCDELSALVTQAPPGEDARASVAYFTAGSDASAWWPADLGIPASTGSQNGARYAYFAAPRRLALHVNGRTTVYDTLDHRIGGFGQQQAGRGTLTFTSQHGIVDVATLPVVSPHPDGSPAAPAREVADVPEAPGISVPTEPPCTQRAAPDSVSSEVIATIEQLAQLERQGILTAAEFAAKKTELLRRL